MSGGAADKLYRPGSSRIHRLPAHAKLVAAVGFVLVMVSTPGRAAGAFAAYAVVLAMVTMVAGVGARFVARGLVIEAPFVLFALLLPFLSGGEQTDVLGIGVSRDGLADAGVLLAKATLGVWTSMLIAGTTRPTELVAALQRLRLPRLLVDTLSFMIRYVDVVADDLRRMRIARASRGFAARGPRQWGGLATVAGALFVRSYERGERVHLAMLSRGYAGQLRLQTDRPADRSEWLVAATLPVLGAAVCAAAWTVVA